MSIESAVNGAVAEAYKLGFLHGLRAYAYEEDGTEYVGINGWTLYQAMLNVENTWNYSHPPKIEEEVKE